MPALDFVQTELRCAPPRPRTPRIYAPTRYALAPTLSGCAWMGYLDFMEVLDELFLHMYSDEGTRLGPLADLWEWIARGTTTIGLSDRIDPMPHRHARDGLRGRTTRHSVAFEDITPASLGYPDLPCRGLLGKRR